MLIVIAIHDVVNLAIFHATIYLDIKNSNILTQLSLIISIHLIAVASASTSPNSTWIFLPSQHISLASIISDYQLLFLSSFKVKLRSEEMRRDTFRDLDRDLIDISRLSNSMTSSDDVATCFGNSPHLLPRGGGDAFLDNDVAESAPCCSIPQK